jgi:hypothetical protein
VQAFAASVARAIGGGVVQQQAIPAFIVSAVERSVIITNAPDSSLIENAWNLALVATNAAIAGSARPGTSPPRVALLSTQSRITRRLDLGAVHANITTTSDVIAVAGARDGATAIQIANAFGSMLAVQLAAIGAWDTVQVGEWSASVNGGLSWWSCSSGDATQCASVTRTRDAFPELGGRADPAENPVGPTVPGVTTPTPLASVVQSVGSNTLLFVGGLVFLVVVVPAGLRLLETRERTRLAHSRS